MSKPTLSRRRFLRYSGLGGGAAVLGLPSLVRAVTSDQPAPEHQHGKPDDADKQPLNRGRMFFTNATDFAALSAAAERIFPRTDTLNGSELDAPASGTFSPGAVDLDVPYFIDNQLAGAWGYNAREYTDGPFFPGTPSQGWQSPLLRREAFLVGISALNNEADHRFGKTFAQLDGADQDSILKDCEEDRLSLPGLSSASFFSLLKEAVLAGVYADPIYNGNRNMDGWRLKDYPGAQMAYSYLMDKDKFQIIPPVSLSSMQ